MARGYLVTVVALAALCSTAHAFIEDAIDILKFGKEIGEEIINSWEVVGKEFNASGGVELPMVHRREREILARLGHVARAIDRLQLTVERGEVLTALVARGGARRTRVELTLHELADLVGRLDASDMQMREYAARPRQYERATIEDYATWCVSHDPGAVNGLLERVHKLVTPLHNNIIGRGIFQMLARDLEVGVDRVSYEQSTDLEETCAQQ